MPMDVEKTARLARLRLSGPERRALSEEMARIMAFADAQEASGEERAEEASAGLSALRADVAGPVLAREEALRAAPARREGCFIVPRALAGEDDDA